MLALLWLHAPLLAIFAASRGLSAPHVAVDVAPVAVCALLGTWQRPGRPVRAGFVAFGLLSCSALLVHLWDGRTEAHFHFFVMMSALALYEDWTPYGLALAYVLVHHGVVGVLAPGSVFAHEAAVRDPWMWSAIHGGFVAAMAVINLSAWRITEDDRAQFADTERRLAHEAGHDPLTGLANRATFSRHLVAVLEEPHRALATAVVYVDLDGFKAVNDRLGHAVGDQLLIAVAERLRSALRPGDVLARFGGDEFVASLCGVDDEQHAERIGRRMSAALRAPVVVGGELLYPEASVGVALAAPGDMDAGALLHRADLAMYQHKQRAGRPERLQSG